MITVDDGFAAAKAIVESVTPRLHDIITEQDARLQLINRFLREALGWDYPDFGTERHNANGYSDYVLSGQGRKRLVVEAKRVGTLVDTLAPKSNTYKVGGPALKSASEGTAQAASYCLAEGTNLAVLTNGIAWIIFRPFPAHGVAYTDANAFVFPTHQSLLEDFSLFFDLLGKPAVLQNTHTLRFAKDGGLSLVQFEPLTAANREEDSKLLAPSELARDLEPIFREFFGSLSAENDREMLIECFVETRESRYADASLEKLLASITTSISSLGSSEAQLQDQITASIETGRGAEVVIVGNLGAGKSTFLERFFESVLEPTIKAKCLLLKIDLSKATVDLSNLSAHLIETLKDICEHALYGDNGPTFEELLGLYFSEYQKRSRGQFKPLYDSDKEAFKRNFGDFLDQKMEQEPYEYLVRMLEQVVKSRHMLPCIVFDNADNLPDARIHEATFQFGHALREAIPYSIVVTPIADRTFWRLSKSSGPIASYPTKKFYLPVPSTKSVLDKRVQYLKRKLEDRGSAGHYFTTRGIRLSIENINAFAACLEEALLQEDFVSRRISWLANNNIKKSLELTQQVIMSPYFTVDDLIKTYIASGPGRLPSGHASKLMKALVLQNYNNFQPAKNEFVMNVFEVSPHSPTSPLVSLTLLKVLINRAGEGAGSAEDMAVEHILQYFDAVGVSESATNYAISTLLSNNLIEPYDTSKDTIETSERIAITHRGRMHFEMATSDPIYTSQMAFATPLRDLDLVDLLRSLHDTSAASEQWQRIQSEFASYAITQDLEFLRLPQDALYDGARALRQTLQSRWIDKKSSSASANTTSAKIKSQGYSHLPVVMKWYDIKKGFGFGEAGLGEDVFVHYALLAQADIKELTSGDTLICDIAVSTQGKLQAIAIHSFERGGSGSTGGIAGGKVVEGKVVFYNPKRAYGFIRSPAVGEDIYFSSKALERGGIKNLTDGTTIWARVELGRFGKGWVASVVAAAPLPDNA